MTPLVILYPRILCGFSRIALITLCNYTLICLSTYLILVFFTKLYTPLDRDQVCFVHHWIPRPWHNVWKVEVCAQSIFVESIKDYLGTGPKKYSPLPQPRSELGSFVRIITL